MFTIRLACHGLSDAEGRAAPGDIEEEFSHRPWQQNVRVHWDGTVLWLEAQNDYDRTGLALLDEFSDAVAACIKVGGATRFTVESVTGTPGNQGG